MNLHSHGSLLLGLVVFVVVTVAGIRYGPSPIAGDEMEYYAMTYAWATTGSPTLTPTVVNAVRAAIPGRPSTEPAAALAADGTWHAIHFWFLSLLATPFFLLCRSIGLDWRHCFAFVNALLFASAAALAYRWLRWFGAAVLVLGLLDSPLLPYLNKAHAEAWSVSLAAIAAMCLVTNRWLAAALSLGAISVQVSAFSPLTVLTLARWWFDRRPRDWFAVSACLAMLSMQPLWTLWRYRTLNLIVAEGYVFTDMATPKRIASILIDPDVGMFFLWPMSVLLIGAIVIGLIRNTAIWRKHRTYWVFAAVLIAEIAWVGAQQINYTTSAPRYSLWFLPFLLIGFVVVVQAGERRLIVPAVGFLLVAAATGYYLFQVAGVEPNLKRKPLAELWYRYLPGVWNPEEQVFADLTLHEQLVSGRDLFLRRRFPIDTLIDPNTWALSNRDCTKLLVFGYAFTSSHVAPRLPLGCEAPIDGGELLRYVRATGVTGMEDRYVSIPRLAARNAATLSTAATENQPPRVVGIQHAKVNDRDVYSFQFSDGNGWQDIDTAVMTISGCYFTYNQPRHELAILRENGTFSPAVVPGRRGSLTTQWCSIDLQAVLVSASGYSLTVKLPILLDPTLSAGTPAAHAVVTDSRTRSQVTFDGIDRFTFPDVSRIWVLINDKRNEDRACYFEYEPVNGTLRLMPDDGDGINATEMRLGDGRKLENGRCILESKAPSAQGELRLNIVRKGLFAGSKRVWTRSQVRDGTLTSWQEAALWRGAGDQDSSPTVSLKPDSLGDILHLEFRYYRPEVPDVSRIWVLVNDTLDAEGACYLTYEPAGGVLRLNGATGNSLTNPQCQVDPHGLLVTATAATVDLQFRIERKGIFASPKRVWVADQKNAGKVSPWTLAGVWR